MTKWPKTSYSKNTASVSIFSQGRKFLFGSPERGCTTLNKARGPPWKSRWGADTSENFHPMMGGLFLGSVKVSNRKLEASTKNIAANGRMEPFSAEKKNPKIGWTEIIWRNFAGKDGGDQEISCFISGLRKTMRIINISYCMIIKEFRYPEVCWLVDLITLHRKRPCRHTEKVLCQRVHRRMLELRVTLRWMCKRL